MHLKLLTLCAVTRLANLVDKSVAVGASVVWQALCNSSLNWVDYLLSRSSADPVASRTH